MSLGFGVHFYTKLSFMNYFSQIKNLQLEDIFCGSANLIYAWDIMLLACQSLTTLDLRSLKHVACKFFFSP